MTSINGLLDTIPWVINFIYNLYNGSNFYNTELDYKMKCIQTWDHQVLQTVIFHINRLFCQCYAEERMIYKEKPNSHPLPFFLLFFSFAFTFSDVKNLASLLALKKIPGLLFSSGVSLHTTDLSSCLICKDFTNFQVTIIKLEECSMKEKLWEHKDYFALRRCHWSKINHMN